MAYQRSNIIGRRTGSSMGGLGGLSDTLAAIGKGALTVIGSQQYQAGQTAALTAQNATMQAQLNAQTSAHEISTGTIVVGAVGAAAVAFLLLRKKS